MRPGSVPAYGPEISIERPGGGVAVLTLNAPERRNALTVAMAEELVAACDELDADADVGAVVVRGEGGFFCAGGDRARSTRLGATRPIRRSSPGSAPSTARSRASASSRRPPSPRCAAAP